MTVHKIRPVSSDRLRRTKYDEEKSPLLDCSSLGQSSQQTSPYIMSTRSLLNDAVTINTQASISSFFTGRFKFTSCTSAVFLTANVTLGAGLLNFPKVFDESGSLFISFILQFILLLFIIGSLFILSYCVDISGAETYEDVVKSFCGRGWATFCTYSIVIYSYGVCLTFLIIIGDQSDRLLASLYGSDFCHTWYMSRHFTITVIAVTLILPMCFAKYIDFLKYPSSAGLLVIMYLLFLITWEYISSTTQTNLPLLPSDWTKISTVIPVICFGYQCHLSWVPTYARMKETAGSPKLIAVIIGSILVSAFCYSFVTIFGVLTIGSGKLDDDILKNYDPHNQIVLIGILSIIFKTVTTYPLILFCARVAIDKWYKRLTRGSVKEKKRLFTIVSVWFITTLIFSVSLPDIGVIIDLLGILTVAYIFIFPGMCLSSVQQVLSDPCKPVKNAFLKIISAIYIILGIFIFLLSLTQWIDSNFFKYKTRSRSLCV